MNSKPLKTESSQVLEKVTVEKFSKAVNVNLDLQCGHCMVYEEKYILHVVKNVVQSESWKW